MMMLSCLPFVDVAADIEAIAGLAGNIICTLHM